MWRDTRCVRSENVNTPYTHVIPIGSELVGATYRPIFSSLVPNSPSLPVLPSSHVTSDSGTGLVHCAPAHGHEDYQVFRDLGLLPTSEALLCHVDGAGLFTDAVRDVIGPKGSILVGKDILNEGNKEMVELLKELGAVKKVKRIKHRYPYDWKTDKPVIIMYDLRAYSRWVAVDVKLQGNISVVC